ncbi:hypothetical protein GCM10022407_34740 [Hymenobacter antarcticus]|uniref:Uncharacterized protein n=1 Tax=Hymenobacter antarcticus TaxID=486270 RepID=A0ABP7QRL7_9BACT
MQREIYLETDWVELTGDTNLKIFNQPLVLRLGKIIHLNAGNVGRFKLASPYIQLVFGAKLCLSVFVEIEYDRFHCVRQLKAGIGAKARIHGFTGQY